MIFNLTQHVGTPEQISQGLCEPLNKKQVQELLTIAGAPLPGELNSRASALVALVPQDFNEVLIGGLPALMGPLERALWRAGKTPIYAFSERVSSEKVGPDGKTEKASVFRHKGFFPAERPE